MGPGLPFTNVDVSIFLCVFYVFGTGFWCTMISFGKYTYCIGPSMILVAAISVTLYQDMYCETKLQ